MFRRKPDAPRKNSGKSLSQYGLFDIRDSMDEAGQSNGSEDNDSDLEAELATLSGQGEQRVKPKPKVFVPVENLAAMVADSMRDIPSDEELSDTDDPDLLSELQELALDDAEPVPMDTPTKVLRSAPPVPTSTATDMVSLLEERIQMYTTAENVSKNANESSRARRFGRGLKTLKDLLKQAKSGKAINEEDIPPVVSVAAHTVKPAADNVIPDGTESHTEPAPQSPTGTSQANTNVIDDKPDDTPSLSDEDQMKLRTLIERRDQYKMAALKLKKEGDNVAALSFVKTVKQFDQVISAVKAGQRVDLSNMPPAPGEKVSPSKQEDHLQTTAEVDPPQPVSETSKHGNEEESTIGDALNQRLMIYKQQETAAREQQNASKARRMGRIVKQFEQAIKLHAAGKPVPLDELPTPPGFTPFVAPGSETKQETEEEPKTLPHQQETETSDDVPADTPAASNKPVAARANSVRKMGNQKGTGHAERQLQILMLRQKEFKQAALNAKVKGEINQAKEFLRCAKGLEPLIEAAQGGFPIDLTTVPLPPQAKKQLEDNFDVISAEDCSASDGGDGDLIGRLEEQLTSQVKFCLNMRNHMKALGDIAGKNRFEHLAVNVKQDLDVVRLAKKLNSDPPKFHYETKEFSIVQCCTELNDNDLELTVVRGLNYGVSNPKEIDTYVKFEFPYPQEQPYQERTTLVKDTNSPEYNSVFTLPINRTARPCLRVFKRHGIKFEIYSRGCCGQPCSCHHLLCFSGFFVRDALIGTAVVKLQPLESQTVLHDTFDIMDGRKKVGGKLEIKLRVRHPLLTKQIEQVSQKWLIIDH